MGSVSRDRFRDYRPEVPGGQDQPDRCSTPIDNLVLEEVATSQYYQTQRSVPPVGTAVLLPEQLHGGRLVLETEDGQVVGLVPTAYNYLVECMSRDYSYAGQVTGSAETPIPVVSARLEPAT